jgi:long-chain fatty acid transport protein
LVLLSIPVTVFGHGFAVYPQGAKATAMGGAFTAQADDPTAIFYNPAGIVQLEGTQATIGLFCFTGSSGTFESNATSGIPGTYTGQTADIEDHTWILPSAYLTHKLNDRISFGIGEFSRFGLGTDWPDNWEGRFAPGGTKAEIQSNCINPVMAFKPLEQLSLAIGPALQYLDYKLEHRSWVDLTPLGIPLTEEVDVKLDGNDWDWGWNLGILWAVTQDLRLGASYRSEVDHSVDGNISFSPEIGPVGLNSTGAEASLSTPAMAFMGIAWSVAPWTFAFDAWWTEWSTFDELSVQYDSLVGGTYETTMKKDWNNTWTWGFGAEYALNEHLDLRGGFIYDESPVPSETLDSVVFWGDSQLYCIGLGSSFGRFTADVSYSYQVTKDRTYNNTVGDEANPGGGRVTGEFKDIDSHLIVVNVTLKF